MSLLLAVCLGCEAPADHAPAIREIVPSSGLDDRAVEIQILGEAFDVRQQWDFESGAATQFDARYQVRVGEILLDDVRWVSPSALAATVPPGLVPGEYAVRVTDPYGRTVELPGGYRVTALADADVRVTGYAVDPIGPQLAGVPFQVHVSAIDSNGQRVDSFNDVVALSDLTGTATPRIAGAFIDGQWSGSVELSAAHPADELVFTDDKGRAGRSSPFAITERPASSLAFVNVPKLVILGSCSEPISLELRDAQGLRTTAASTIVASLAATPAPARFFSDASCSTPVTMLSFAPGTSRANLHVQSPLSGDVGLEASAPNLTTASAQVQIANALAGLRSPPEARLTATPTAVPANGVVTLSAAGSTDGQSSSVALEVSFDFSGTASGVPGVSPWTPWSKTKTTTTSFSTTGWRVIRVAVRDEAGDISYATANVNVTASVICRVTVGSGDDGATSCTNNLGPDKGLSLQEAVRIANATSGLQEIELAPGLTVSGAAVNFTDDALIYGAPGASIDGVAMSVSGQKLVGLVGVDLRGAATTVQVGTGSTFYVIGGLLDGIGGIVHQGAWLYVAGARFRACAGNPCIDMGGTAERVVLSDLDADGAAGRTFLEVKSAAGNNGQKPVEVRGSVFTRFGTALRLASGLTYGAEVLNNTFHANGVGIDVQSGQRFVFRNNLFTQQSIAAFQGCASAVFETRDYHQLFGNASDGCIASDPYVLSADPLYLVPSSRDLRLRFDSPAKNSGIASNTDVDDQGPGSYRGAAPDRGGEETW